jgi:hypothetical protein
VSTHPKRSGFDVDEEPLRAWILKAYHEQSGDSDIARFALEAVRRFLSGPDCGDATSGLYWFEENPREAAEAFVREVDALVPGLASGVLEPLIAAARPMEKSGTGELASNMPLFLSGLAGSIHVRWSLDECVAQAVLAALILGLAHAGTAVFEKALART